MCKRKKKISLLVFLLITSTFMTTSRVNSQAATDTNLYFTDLSQINVDGIVDTDEYPTIEIVRELGGTQINTLAWGHNNTHIAIALSCECSGWLGIGLGEISLTMGDANLIMGNVTGNDVNIIDMWAEGNAIPIPDSDSIINTDFIAGIENGTSTTLEFIIPMSSDDIVGHDQDWKINGTYGFFTAFQASSDDMTVKHTIFSRKLSVRVVEFPAQLTEINMTLNVYPGNTEDTYDLIVSIVKKEDNEPIMNLDVNFYTKTRFGNLFYATSQTNETGIANATISTSQKGNLTFVAIFPGSLSIQRTETSLSQYFEPINEMSTKFDDLRDTFDRPYLIRDFLLLLLYFIISILIIAYLGVFLDIFKIFRLRKGPKLTEKEERIH